jgi:hypothetical protein
MSRPHLFVDVSAHGFGHLAQVAPVLNALTERLPALRLTIRSGLPTAKLQARIAAAFTHLIGSSDFGYVMHDAVSLDLPATALAYRRQHADWPAQVGRDARVIAGLRPDLVFSDVAYLPLAAAAQVGIPSVAMCSLNWADLFAHFFAGENWAAEIHGQMLAAYHSVECFLRLTPGMAMPELRRLRSIAPVAALGNDCREALRRQVGCATGERLVLIAFGGVSKALPIADWPPLAGVRWLIPQDWQLEHPSVVSFEGLGRPFTDLLCSVDAVITKPGYGTFAEAACNGTPVLYLRRADWPEQDALIDWLNGHARCLRDQRGRPARRVPARRAGGPMAAAGSAGAPAVWRRGSRGRPVALVGGPRRLAACGRAADGLAARRAEHALDVARDQVDFQVDAAARLQTTERRRVERMGNQVDAEGGAVDRVGGQADAIDGDRALAGDVPGERCRRADFEQTIVADRIETQYLADAVDVPGDEVAAEAIGQTQRLLEIDRSGRRQTDGAGQRFGRDIDAETVVAPVNDGQADAVAGDRIAQAHVVQCESAGVDGQADGARAVVAGGDAGDLAKSGDDSREHGDSLAQRVEGWIPACGRRQRQAGVWRSAVPSPTVGATLSISWGTSLIHASSRV